jgi:lipopolysaccharide/colanic/teichoic acid biosynthesis glycosyltransferase
MIPSIMHTLFIFFLIVITLPIQLVISIFIVMSSGFPILFQQTRTGKKNKPFTMYKFRTMNKGAEKLQKQLLKQNEADGPVFKIRNDPRFTPFGKFLSHTGLDELPQLWNILKGNMALIGPRPLPLDEARKLTKWQQKRHTIKPGIISPWIFDGYHRRPFHEWMKSDIEYANNKSMLYDSNIFIRTIQFLIKLFFYEVLPASPGKYRFFSGKIVRKKFVSS